MATCPMRGTDRVFFLKGAFHPIVENHRGSFHAARGYHPGEISDTGYAAGSQDVIRNECWHLVVY